MIGDARIRGGAKASQDRWMEGLIPKPIKHPQGVIQGGVAARLSKLGARQGSGSSALNCRDSRPVPAFRAAINPPQVVGTQVRPVGNLLTPQRGTMSHQLRHPIKGLTVDAMGTTAEPVCEMVSHMPLMARVGRKLTASSRILLAKGQGASLANAMLLTTREQWLSVINEGTQLRL